MRKGIYSLYPREAHATNLGLLFVIPFICGWVFVVNPLIALETALGQVAQSGPFVRKYFSFPLYWLPLPYLIASCVILSEHFCHIASANDWGRAGGYSAFIAHHTH